MLSKLYPAQFIEESSLNQLAKGPIVLVCSDETILYCIKKKLSAFFELRAVWDNEVSNEWIQDNFGNLNFFQDQLGGAFFFYHLQNLEPQILQNLCDSISSEVTLQVLHFEKLTRKFEKSLTERFSAYQIVHLKSWELNKLTDFFEIYFQSKMSPEFKAFLAKFNLEKKLDIYSFLETIFLAKQSFMLSGAELKQYDRNEDYDFFKVGEEFFTRSKSFFTKLIDLIERREQNSLIHLFNFIRNVLLNSCDSNSELTSFYAKKTKTLSSNYSQTEIIQFLKILGSWEILVKSKQWPLIKAQVKNFSISSFKSVI
jgi:hypothetical protein